jgi:hypothetical protein
VRATLGLQVDGETLVRIGADLAVAGFFRDQRPLRGGAGIADWRLCGWLSGLVDSARVSGEAGERLLLLTHGRIGAPRLLLLGLGSRSRFGVERHRDAVRDAVLRVLDLGAATAALDLPAPAGDDSPEGIADGLLEGACEALKVRPARVLLRLAVPPGLAPRLRGALERGAASLPRGGTTVKMLRPTPAAPASSGPPPAPAPRGARPSTS